MLLKLVARERDRRRALPLWPARSFVSCASVTTQRTRDGRTSSQQHGRPSVSALRISCAPLPQAPTTGIDGGPTALYCINYCLVLCHCQGCSNVKWLLLCKFIGVLQYEIVFTLQDYHGVRRYGPTTTLEQRENLVFWL